MSTFKKHVGRIKNTDRRCVVIYMQIPGNEDNALIVDTDALPDRFHDALMDIIDSTEGQQTAHLHTLLSRRMLPDLGLDMMNALHTYGLLRSVAIDNVVMYPAPNAPCPLRTIVDFINNEEAPEDQKVNLDNRILENQKADQAQGQLDVATNILRQAEDLEAEAAKKREQAYRLVPSLRPQVTPSPEVTEASETAQDSSTVEVPLEAPTEPAQDQSLMAAPSTPTEPELIIDPTLPDDVKAALEAAHIQLTETAQVIINDTEGNQVDSSDDAVQAFLDRVAHREDLADKELQESLKPKNPVGRPRKDGLPAGTKPEAAPKKRGRPPKAKK